LCAHLPPPLHHTPTTSAPDTRPPSPTHAVVAQIIYFPPGTYLVSQPLTFPRESSGATSRKVVLGACVTCVTLQLADRVPPFANPASPAAVVHLGNGVAQNFFNAITGLTVNTGHGNPGAIGMQFDANNMGHVRNVSLVAPDGDGVIGLDLSYTDQGERQCGYVRVPATSSTPRLRVSLHATLAFKPVRLGSTTVVRTAARSQRARS